MNLSEQYGLRINKLEARMDRTAKFETPHSAVNNCLSSLIPKTRNHLLNIGVGVEIEVENARGFDVPQIWWETEGDNSLRHAGLEFKTPFGIRIHSVLNNLEVLWRHIQRSQKDHPLYFSFSERTSVHIHLDVRNFSFDHLSVLTLIYTLFEDALFKFAGEHRKSNIFCVPLKDSTVIGSYDTLKQYIRVWDKYCAFNLKAVPHFGTVEFRHMEGNADPLRIFLWICLLGMMHSYAWQTPLEQVQSTLQTLKSSSDYTKLLQDVFGKFAVYLSIDPILMDEAISDARLFFVEKGN